MCEVLPMSELKLCSAFVTMTHLFRPKIKRFEILSDRYRTSCDSDVDMQIWPRGIESKPYYLLIDLAYSTLHVPSSIRHESGGLNLENRAVVQ